MILFIISLKIQNEEEIIPITKEDIDESLGELIYGCNLPLRVVESDRFKKFVANLNPNYTLPSRKYLSNGLLKKMHARVVTGRQTELQGKQCVLLIDGWKNSSSNRKNLVCSLYNADVRKHYFLESYDITCMSETADCVTNIVKKATNLAKELYNTEIIAIVTDNVSTMTCMGKKVPFLYATCNSHSGNLLLNDLANPSKNSDITDAIKVLKEFKKSNLEAQIVELGGRRSILPGDTRWCSYRDSCQCLLNNLPFMRLMFEERTEISDISVQIVDKIIDVSFEDRVRNYVDLFDPICQLINSCQQSTTNQADATQKWLELDFGNSALNEKLKARIKKAIHPVAAAANFLHPVYKGEKLTEELINKKDAFLQHNLDADGFAELELFKRKEGIFQKLFDKNFTLPLTFWDRAKCDAPNLSSLAIKIFMIPASTADLERLFSNWSYVHSKLRNRLTSERSKMLVDIYHHLRYENKWFSEEFVDPLDV